MSKCHLNLCVSDTSQWEQSAAYCLDVHPGVAAWVKNDHLGLFIRYRKGGQPHHYIPDFVVRLSDERMLIVEIKGQLGDAEIKRTAAERWVKAVSREKGFGQWSYHLLKHPADLMKLLGELTGQTAGLPEMEEADMAASSDGKPVPATKDDWPNLLPMTEDPVWLPLDLRFTEAQMANIRLGFIPPAQEFKWFACFDGQALDLYRSWSGFHMFRVYLEPDGDGWRATHADVNLDPEYVSESVEGAM